MLNLKSVKEILKEVTNRMDKAIEATKREFQNIRTARASTSLVEGISVDYYNTPTPLKNLATLTTPDPKTIAVQPWDQTSISEIEKAIQKSNLGITPIRDGKIIRIPIPPLSEERRLELVKVIKKIAEEGKISIRNARHEGIEAIKRIEKEGVIGEDISFQQQKDIQKLTDDHIKTIDQVSAKKEAEIKEV